MLAVVAVEAVDEPRAAALAGELGLPLLPTASDPVRCGEIPVLLVVEGNALRLQQTGRNAPGPVAVEFGGAAMRHRRRGGHNELLGRAVGVGRKPGLRVLDATAGLGRDSFVLADLGCRVLMCEREPVLATLLRCALEAAAAADDQWLRTVVGRMSLVPGDARELDRALLAEQDVIYLDPMYPRQARGGAVKKEMALFRQLLRGDRPGGDDRELLEWALSQAIARVVVKRPARGEELGGRRPSHQLLGKAVRYDVYTLGPWQ
jgi:16S rRNA (guanine1516-N2)-methyltransferase